MMIKINGESVILSGYVPDISIELTLGLAKLHECIKTSVAGDRQSCAVKRILRLCGCVPRFYPGHAGISQMRMRAISRKSRENGQRYRSTYAGISRGGSRHDNKH